MGGCNLRKITVKLRKSKKREMLKVPEVENLSKFLKELGFKSKKEYATSDFYLGIKNKILTRDLFLCRSLGCQQPANKIGYTNFDLHTLCGNPHFIFSLCDQHYTKSRIISPPDSERLSLNFVFTLVSGLRKLVKDKPDSRIGLWYRDQNNDPRNARFSDEIYRDVVRSLPPERQKIREYWDDQKKKREKEERE